MGSRLLVIGVDALDTDQLARWENALPNLARMKRKSPQTELASVFPPDSDTAWASIYTGLNPVQHGVLHFEDPVEKSARYLSKEPDNSAIRGRTFWDTASRQGKRVCVLFPHLGFPVWAVNGVMIGRSAIKKKLSVYPSDRFPGSRLDSTNVVQGLPGWRLERYIQANTELLQAQLSIAMELLTGEEWDLFFFYSSILDMIQHYFWNFCDPSDPTYPGQNPFQRTIQDFYVLHDEAIGKLVAAASERSAVLVLSDHGHGMRPVRVLNVNEFLRRNGLLAVVQGSAKIATAGALERAKRWSMRVVSGRRLGEAAGWLLKKAPWGRNLYSKSALVDWDRTVGISTHLSSFKAYPYGGIRVLRGGSSATYEAIREEIIRGLASLSDPLGGGPALKWVRKREELYDGPHIQKYPDIIFECSDGLGSCSTWDSELFGIAPTHALVPGSHRSDGAVFLMANAGSRAPTGKITLMDVKGIIESCLAMGAT